MKPLRIYLLPVVIVLINSSHYAQPLFLERVIQKNEQHYLSNTIIIKFKVAPLLKSNNTIVLSDKLTQLLGSAGLVSSNNLFASRAADKETGLDKISVIKYSSDIDPQILASKISKLGDVEWAEPKFVYPVEFIPNDPLYSSQYALTKIQAHEAWNLTTGDTSVIIAIIDTGVDWDHPDLAANVWRNWGETPGNGIDDDFNGFIDDVRGWDFGGLNGTPDNNPMEDRPDHGTHVAGDASAVTDNSIGVASIGFKSKIMAVKTNRDDLRAQNGLALIPYGYEGIKYAADNGAKIINCSWGGGGGYSLLGQEVINYATSLGALVVAAAGNNNSSDPFYPASYNNVLSVAATDGSDLKASFSNYGSGVDVSAPGVGINSTWQNDVYTSGSGTSFSSPIVAGLAALVKSKFPLFTPNQVAEQIRANCDDINTNNPGFINQLGKGRVNAFNSLSNTNSKSVRAVDVKFSDELPGGNGDGVLQSGEIIKVRCTFINYLSPTANLGIYLESSNNYSTVLNGGFNVGATSTLDIFINEFNEFTFQLSQNVPQNTNLNFNINFLDGPYQDFQIVRALVNPTYATQAGNDVALTITSKGTLAFNDYPINLQGDGFKYLDGSNHLFEGALMLATSSTQVSDCARGSDQSKQNNDFTTIQPFILKSPGTYADLEGSCIINDNGAGSNMIGIQTKLNSFSFNDLENQNYILLRYDLTNTSSTTINNLYAGLFLDWDIADGSNDFATYDMLGNFGYAYHIGGNPNTWVASALASSSNYGFWAINNAGGDGGFSIYDGFTDAEKWQALSSGIGKPQAGAGDISHVVSGGPFSIQPNETIPVAFSIAAGLNIDELRTAIANSRNKYSQIPTSTLDEKIEQPGAFYLSQNFPNPFNPSTRIRYQVSRASNVSLKIYDVLGNEVITLVNGYKPEGSYEVDLSIEEIGRGLFLPSGVYFYRLKAGEFVDTKKMILLR